jgi:predicted phosphodiesterase
MKSRKRQILLAFGDVHIPYHHKVALEVFCRVAELVRPDLLICLGDLLDCSQFSSHPPTWGVNGTAYEDDLITACALLDRLQKTCKKLVLIEGNHEYRIDRWAALTAEGRGAYSLLTPKRRLTQGRKCVYVPYGSASGHYPYYRINNRIVAIHGWSHGRNATRQHLTISQGKSVIHGNSHRADSVIIQNIWSPGKIIEARSAGCLCQLIPFYGTGRPVEWVHAFIIGYLGRRSDALYTVPIVQNGCILPDGKEVRV